MPSASLCVTYEIIINDDGSTDNTWALLQEMAQADGHIRAQRFKNKCGQSAAIWAGLKAARGRVIVTLDADMQNDLSDLPVFLEALKHYDCACGSRVKTRRDGDSFICFISSRIANGIRNKVLNENFSDPACGYRAFRRDCLPKIKFFNGAHRFLPTLFTMAGLTVTQVPIKSNPRFSGHSHYGTWKRAFYSLIDLWGLWWMKKRLIRYEIIEAVN